VRLSSFPTFYPIVDAEVAEAHGWTAADLGKALFDGGATLVQLRCSGYSLARFLSCADELLERASRYDAQVIINDRIDIATMSGADGVHVGQDDLSVRRARQLSGPGLVVGVSTHTLEQFSAIRPLGVDYAAVGPIYDTRTKNTGYYAVGLEAIRSARSFAESVPLVAIGGITLETGLDVLEAGATSLAVITDIFTGGDPTQRTRDYVERLSL
jgi:thiamine-phosphate pyrophosphorylase|tara:strand:- start:4748 stop:5386 length:639 start_codon:yes stop_codon:yes gene_type:complete